MLETSIGADLGDIREGNRCLMNVIGRRHMVEVCEVEDDFFRVSFPASDYPVEGMVVELEFHDKLGFNLYRCDVLRGPEGPGTGAILRRPAGAIRSMHRDSCRIPTDLTVQLKDQVHVRRYDGALINLSGGGALVRTQGPFTFDTTIEMSLSLPGQPAFMLLCLVAHVTEDTADPRTRILGLRFMGMEKNVTQSVTNFIWKRLQELYSAV